MAIGDTKAGLQSISAGAVLDIRPPSGEEWIIHNFYYDNGPVEINKTDGTNVLKFDNDISSGGRLGTVFHVTNTQWIQIKNTTNTTTLIGYDGIQTK